MTKISKNNQSQSQDNRPLFPGSNRVLSRDERVFFNAARVEAEEIDRARIKRKKINRDMILKKFSIGKEIPGDIDHITILGYKFGIISQCIFPIDKETPLHGIPSYIYTTDELYRFFKRKFQLSDK